MTIKKAIIIGTLCAIGTTLTAYAVKKGIEIKPKTITAANADSLYTQKNIINSDPLNDGWQYEVRPTDLTENNQTFWTDPVEKTETKPTTLSNTTWTFKNEISFDSLNLENGQTKRFNIEFKATNATRPYGTFGALIIRHLTNGAYEIEYQRKSGNNIPAWTSDNNEYWNWEDENLKTIQITNGNDTTTQNLIDFLWNNQKENPTFLANKRYENYTSSYLGIEYVMMSQKTFSEGKVKNETLFFIKLQSTGITRQLYLEDLVIYTTIPNMKYYEEYPTYNAKFKMSKMTSMNITESTNIWQEKGSFLNKYNSIQNKTNIYSVDASATGVNIGQQQNITYSNETGTTGTATFGHAGNTGTNTTMWTIHQNTDIYTQGRANYVVIYTSCDVSDFTPFTEEQHEGWYKYLYKYVGATTQFKGYGISSNPITPPDIENGNFMSLTGFILNILTLPFTFLSQAFDLTLWANTPWAFNIKNAIFVMIGIMTFIFIIKLFTRGFDSLGNYTSSISKNKVNRSQAKLNKEKAKLAARTDPNTKTKINKKE